MIERAPTPALIRGRPLERMQEHRARFVALVDRIYGEAGVSRNFRDEWPDVFFHKRSGAAGSPGCVRSLR